MQKDIAARVEANQVTVISGATGCGKSTQVPQFILDAMLESGHGAGCNIVCTQPRRLAAIGVADRVSVERAGELGQEVGYQIRLEQKRSRNTRLLFCTTGILLRTLEGDPDLLGKARNRDRRGGQSMHTGPGPGSRSGHTTRNAIDADSPVSHVIVDEVHERSIDSDFLLIILRELLRRRPHDVRSISLN